MSGSDKFLASLRANYAAVEDCSKRFKELVQEVIASFSWSPTMFFYAPYQSAFTMIKDIFFVRTPKGMPTRLSFGVAPAINENGDVLNLYDFYLICNERWFIDTLANLVENDELKTKLVEAEDFEQAEELLIQEYGGKEAYLKMYSFLRGILIHEAVHLLLAHAARAQEVAEKFGFPTHVDENSSEEEIAKFLTYRDLANRVEDAFVNEGIKYLYQKNKELLDQKVKKITYQEDLDFEEFEFMYKLDAFVNSLEKEKMFIRRNEIAEMLYDGYAKEGYQHEAKKFKDEIMKGLLNEFLEEDLLEASFALALKEFKRIEQQNQQKSRVCSCQNQANQSNQCQNQNQQGSGNQSTSAGRQEQSQGGANQGQPQMSSKGAPSGQSGQQSQSMGQQMSGQNQPQHSSNQGQTNQSQSGQQNSQSGQQSSGQGNSSGQNGNTAQAETTPQGIAQNNYQLAKAQKLAQKIAEELAKQMGQQAGQSGQACQSGNQQGAQTGRSSSSQEGQSGSQNGLSVAEVEVDGKKFRVVIGPNGEILDIDASDKSKGVSKEEARERLKEETKAIARKAESMAKSVEDELLDDEERQKFRGFGQCYGRSIAKITEKKFKWTTLLKEMIKALPGKSHKKSWIQPIRALKRKGYHYPDDDTTEKLFDKYSIIFMVDASGSMSNREVAEGLGTVISGTKSKIDEFILIPHDYELAPLTTEQIKKIRKYMNHLKIDRDLLKKSGILKVNLQGSDKPEKYLKKIVEIVAKDLPSGGTSHVRPLETFFKIKGIHKKLHRISGIIAFTDCESDLSQITPRFLKKLTKSKAPMIIINSQKGYKYSHPHWTVVDTTGKLESSGSHRRRKKIQR